MRYQDLENCMEDKLLELHTAFVGKVVKTDGKTATIQPMHLIKQIGEPEEKQAVIADVPILQSVRKFRVVERSCEKETRNHVELEEVAVGDIMYCLCAERDLTDARDGKFHLPTERHSLKDAVVIGVF